MSETKNSTTTKVLRTQRQVMTWTMLITDLLVLVLVFGGWLLLHMMDYVGGLEELRNSSFLQVRLEADLPPEGLRFLLTLDAIARETAAVDVTAEIAVLLVSMVAFGIVLWIFCCIIQALGRQRLQSHMQQVTQLAQEARRLGAEEARRNLRTPQVDALEEAIDQISPTQNTRLHIGDPDLKGLEEAVNDLLDRTQAAYSQQVRFVSDASHELRTPIAVLKGYADLLERWGKDDPQVRDEAISAIQAEAERMNRLVEQLLFLARGDSGRTQLRCAPLDLSELAREAWEESRMIDAEHTWELDAPEPVCCRADRDMLKQALRILADNAAKYTPAGKTITLQSFLNTHGQPCLSVRDQGIGIKTEDAPHVFERFYRSDRARTRQSGGAGLGLSIADWIVTQHNGHIEIYSWEGIGSRFTIVIKQER